MAIAGRPAALRTGNPRIIDLATTVDSEVAQTPAGPMAWGSVEITYSLEGLEPRVTIRVPVPAFETESDEQRRSEALRRARKLIDHACVAMEAGPQASIGEVLEGISEELGLLPPTTRPRQSRRS
jgi:hypothetical protein